jgi:hypothetical protein
LGVGLVAAGLVAVLVAAGFGVLAVSAAAGVGVAVAELVAAAPVPGAVGSDLASPVFALHAA